MTTEILSIIAVCISGITAICSATIPAILNYTAKKAELKEKIKREQEQAYEAKFEVFYQAHLRVLNEFSNLYQNWSYNPENSSELISFIYEVAPEFRYSVSGKLYELIERIEHYKADDNLDEYYKTCRQLILDSYGVRVSSDTPDIFMSDMLKVVLKEQFNKLQKATSKDFKFHKY